MLIPIYWAEVELSKKRENGRTVRVRRFGWSNDSQVDARNLAHTRATDALDAAFKGQKVRRFESRSLYNGADGIPIREEILEEHGQAIMTRNSYGAHCLNTPNLLMIDIDVDAKPVGGGNFSCLLQCALYLSLVIGLVLYSKPIGWVLLGLTSILAIVSKFRGQQIRAKGELANQEAFQNTLLKIEAFAGEKPDWHIRIYQTPHGYRLVIPHRCFDANEEEVLAAFQILKADPIYIKMCQLQNCFRARLTAKPWRIEDVRLGNLPKPKWYWPVPTEMVQERRAWIERYESKAKSYAACQLIKQLGPKVVATEVAETLRLHDERSRALSGLPLA